MTENVSRRRIIAFVVALGFVTAAYYHYWRAEYRLEVYPRATYLFRPNDQYTYSVKPPISGIHMFGDLLAVSQMMHDRDPYRPHPETGLPTPSNYPPFIHVVTWMFSYVPYPLAVAVYCILAYGIIGTFWVYTVGTGNNMETWLTVLILTAMSYPVQFVIDRGNVEVFAFGFAALFCVNYLANRPNASAAWLGLAAAAKIFPGVFVVVLLVEKRWKACLIFLATMTLATFASSVLLKGGLFTTAQGFPAALRTYAHMVNDSDPFAFGWGVRGAFGFNRHIASVHPFLVRPIAAFQKHFNVIVLMPLALVLLGSTALPGLKRWERLILVVGVIACVPVPVPDYLLLYLFVPIAAFVNESDIDENTDAIRSGRLTAVLFALLLVPWAYATDFERHEGTIIRPALLMLIYCRIVATRVWALSGYAAFSWAQRRVRAIASGSGTVARRPSSSLARSVAGT